MNIKIERYDKSGRKLSVPECINQYGYICKHTGEICNCSVYSGNSELPNKFEVK